MGPQGPILRKVKKKMNNSNSHVFSQIPRIKIPRSVFDRSHSVKTAIGVDYLYPIFVDEVLPSDTFDLSFNIFGRLATPVVPIMDDLYLDIFFFFVPNRLVDKNWAKIMGESSPVDPRTGTFQETNVPTLTFSAGFNGPHGLCDYFGMPTRHAITVCPYFHRAYNLIWNEFFRDENLQPYAKVGGNTLDTSGTELPADYVLRKRCKVHDYFTSALPYPFRGNPVSISIGGSAPVYGDDNNLIFTTQYTSGAASNAATDQLMYLMHKGWAGNNNSNTYSTLYAKPTAYSSAPNMQDDTAQYGVRLAKKVEVEDMYGSAGLVADLSAAQAVSVNQLREAFATQQFLELCNRCGTRYVETILGHFGCVAGDARLQRPEYLGGCSRPLNVTSVPQTSSTDTTSPQGNLAAYVTGSGTGRWTKSFVEHGIILGLANIRAINQYQQGMPRMFTRSSRFDFYWPSFANLGEQTVLQGEIYHQGNGEDSVVFGYQERYAEYRYHPSIITGAMRSDNSTGLDVWHLGQYFTEAPRLNSSFIESSVPIARSIALQTDIHDQFILDGYFRCRCARPMPVYSVPGLRRM